MHNNKGLLHFFHFTRKDRIFGIVVMVVVTGSLFLPRFFASSPNSISFTSDSTLVLAMDTLQYYEAKKPFFKREENQAAYQYERSTTNSYNPGALFLFDPNIITVKDWIQLGLNEKTSKTILKYVQKGGRFYKPDDLQKIWGMPKGFYERVKEHIRITAVKKEYATYTEKRPPFIREEKKPVVININLADTTAFIQLPGIGTKLSARIIAFREKLGGFYSVEQLAETYGLPDSTFQKIKSRLQTSENLIRKININTATKEELKSHPYIKWALANAIVEYRNQHGEFKTVEELRNIVLIDEPIYSKLTHYVIL